MTRHGPCHGVIVLLGLVIDALLLPLSAGSFEAEPHGGEGPSNRDLRGYGVADCLYTP